MNTHTVRVRVAEVTDAPAICQAESTTAATSGLLVARPGEIPLHAYVAKIITLATLGSYWVAEEQGETVGHAFLEPMEMTANAHVLRLNLVVHPGFTNRGIGTALMSEMVNWSRQNSQFTKIELLVRSTNTAAIALYKKLGFVEEGRLRNRLRTLDGGYIDDLTMAWFPY